LTTRHVPALRHPRKPARRIAPRGLCAARGGAAPGARGAGQTQKIAPGQSAGDDSFSSMLSRMVSDINHQQNVANQTVNALQSGQGVPLHQAIITMEEANVSFQLMVEVRNRLLESYQEIMRMQV
jgi:flagellar hook-basal body complex protein FliE